MFNKKRKKIRMMKRRELGFDQTVHFENVISCYFQVDLDDFSPTFEEFVRTVLNSGYTPKSNFFYSINSDLNDTRDMILQVFIPVEEDRMFDLPSEYRFQSYYEVINMIGVRVEGNGENHFQEAIQILVEEIVDMNVNLASPPFYFVNQLNGKVFTDIMIKVS